MVRKRAAHQRSPARRGSRDFDRRGRGRSLCPQPSGARAPAAGGGLLTWARGYDGAMARSLLAGIVVAAALSAVGLAAVGRLPIIRSVTVAHRHVVTSSPVGDLRPVEFTVAERTTDVGANGALLREERAPARDDQASFLGEWRRALAEPGPVPPGRLLRAGDGC